MSYRSILITGCYRSGTTLLEKLLHSHPEITIASQPYPVLFILAKRTFLERLGLPYRYPLDHLFKEDRYSRDDFCSFLSEHKFSSDDVKSLLAELAEYKDGLWTPEILKFGSSISPGSFFDISRQLNECVNTLFSDLDSRYVGSKEVLVEEYLPCLLDNGWSVVLIIRDPRDMIASLNSRVLDNKTGEKRPTLFSLRAWRKSVAYAFGMEGRPRMQWIRYENLVEDLEPTINGVARSLRVSPYGEDSFDKTLKDQYGEVWRGNSSFDSDFAGIDHRPVGRFESVLNDDTIAFVEAVCYPEMVALGYKMRKLDSFSAAALYNFREPADIGHEKFDRGYSADKSRLAAECERVEMLSAAKALSVDKMRSWFIHEGAYERLSRNLNTSAVS